MAFKQLFEELGHETIVPPKPSKRTLTLGTQHAPEFACIPFKVLLGTYLEAMELGADTIISSGGVGPCRAGWYGHLHQRILADLGHDPRFIIFDPPLTNIWNFMTKLRQVVPFHHRWVGFSRIIRRVWSKLSALDTCEMAANEVRARELIRGQTTKAFEQALVLIDQACRMNEIREAHHEALRLIRAVPQDPLRDVLRIGLIGEIYVVLEPFINLEIERLLGEQGVWVDRSIYLTGYGRKNILARGRVFDGEQEIKKVAKDYLPLVVGGHGMLSLGEIALYAKRGFDGVVQLAPFSCIPEIVAKSVIPHLSRELGIPVMTAFLDEQTGKAGMQTRVEAFADLLRQRRRLRVG